MTEQRTPSVSAVLPAYNESAGIGEVVPRAARALTRLGVPNPQIIVVDDGSRDGTADAARQGATPGVALDVIAHDVNRGYGAALRTGFDAAERDAVWLMDSDGQFDPDDLERLLPHYQPDRMVVGYRIRRNDPVIRRL